MTMLLRRSSLELGRARLLASQVQARSFSAGRAPLQASDKRDETIDFGRTCVHVMNLNQHTPGRGFGDRTCGGASMEQRTRLG